MSDNTRCPWCATPLHFGVASAVGSTGYAECPNGVCRWTGRVERRQDGIAPIVDPATENVVRRLQARGLLTTTTEGCADHVGSAPTSVYLGFDPTGPTLHLGHLLPLVALARFAQAGHRPVVVLGTATAAIGDPSGRTASRPVLSPTTLKANTAALRAQLEAFFARLGIRPLILENTAWYTMGFPSFLHGVCAKLPASRLLATAGVRERLEREQGMTVAELMYPMVQAFDFHHLRQRCDVTVQIGGSDQWTNMIAGVDLIKRLSNGKGSRSVAHVAAVPLLTHADGTKIGKSGGVTVGFDSPAFVVYQHLINLPDEDAATLLRLVGSAEDVERVADVHSSPQMIKAVLGAAVLLWTHGPADYLRALSGAFAPKGDGIPTVALPADAGLVSVLKAAGLVVSNSDARRMVGAGGVYVNDERVTDFTVSVKAGDVLRVGQSRAVRVTA